MSQNSPRAMTTMQGVDILSKIVQHVDAVGVRAIECLFLADTDGSGAIDREEFNGAVQHMIGKRLPQEETDLAFAVLCLDGDDENINIEQFISFQQRERRTRERQFGTVEQTPADLVARSLLALDGDERDTVIEEMAKKEWLAAIEKQEHGAETFYAEGDGDSDALTKAEQAQKRSAKTLVVSSPPFSVISPWRGSLWWAFAAAGRLSKRRQRPKPTRRTCRRS